MSETISYMLKQASGQILPAMASVLKKASVYAAQKKVDESVLLNARLFPDMLPLVRQVQIAGDTVMRGAARLAGLDMPTTADTEVTFAELIERLGQANAYVQAFEDAALNANERTLMDIPLGQMTVQWDGRQYLSTFVLPNLHFHAAISYALLRHQGLVIGKRDFLMADG